MKLIMESWRSFVNENKNPCDCKACFEYTERAKQGLDTAREYQDAAHAAGCFDSDQDPERSHCRDIHVRYSLCRAKGADVWDCDPCKEVT